MSMTVHIAMKGITDLEILLSALHEMGIESIRPNAKHKKRGRNVLAFADIHAQRVQFVRHKNGEINMVGDSDWRIIKDHGFQQRLRQQYSLETVKKKVAELRYNLASIETLEDGAIKLVARAWR
jgi:Protein of unknown function (DUF1257)